MAKFIFRVTLLSGLVFKRTDLSYFKKKIFQFTIAQEKIDGIAATPGADVLFVDPTDPTLTLGIFGQLDHPLYQQAIQDVA